jgi:hypothetical protein
MQLSSDRLLDEQRADLTDSESADGGNGRRMFLDWFLAACVDAWRQEPWLIS